MSNYKNERNDLSELAYLYCKDVKGIDRNLLNGLCIEARCTILNRFLKEISSKQYSSKNLTKLATSIYEKNKGEVNIQKFHRIHQLRLLQKIHLKVEQEEEDLLLHLNFFKIYIVFIPNNF